MSDTILFWIIMGLCLIFLEFLVPGLVVIFLGLGALFVALLQWSGILESWTTSFATWFGSSFAFLILLRSIFRKFLPSEVTKDYSDEDDEAFGAIVDVLETVNSHNNEGRIKFSGTTWSAQCIEGEIKVGQKAKIVYRNDLAWVIEPYDHLLAADDLCE